MTSIKSINRKLSEINPKLLLTLQEKYDDITPATSDSNCFVLNKLEGEELTPICDYIQLGEDNEYLLLPLIMEHQLTVPETLKLVQLLNMAEGA